MPDKSLDDFYKVKQIDASGIEEQLTIGNISEKEKFAAAKQILLGIALLYIFTVLAYLWKPVEGAKLIDICTTAFPPLATLLLVYYFRQH